MPGMLSECFSFYRVRRCQGLGLVLLLHLFRKSGFRFEEHTVVGTGRQCSIRLCRLKILNVE
jgi:hypothetical protein